MRICESPNHYSDATLVWKIHKEKSGKEFQSFRRTEDEVGERLDDILHEGEGVRERDRVLISINFPFTILIDYMDGVVSENSL